MGFPVEEITEKLLSYTDKQGPMMMELKIIHIIIQPIVWVCYIIKA